jgi:uncharacterized protein YndB with AHSA1/START domain
MSADRTLTIGRLFQAAPAQVWAAWTDPDVLPRWFGPEGFVCHTHEIDLRDGGLWRFDMIGRGMTFANRHRDFRYTPVTRLRFLMDDDVDGSPASEVVVTLTPEGSGTRLVQVMTLPSVEARIEAEGFGAVEMGQTTLAKLARALGE